MAIIIDFFSSHVGFCTRHFSIKIDGWDWFLFIWSSRICSLFSGKLPSKNDGVPMLSTEHIILKLKIYRFAVLSKRLDQHSYVYIHTLYSLKATNSHFKAHKGWEKKKKLSTEPESWSRTCVEEERFRGRKIVIQGRCQDLTPPFFVLFESYFAVRLSSITENLVSGFVKILSVS